MEGCYCTLPAQLAKPQRWIIVLGCIALIVRLPFSLAGDTRAFVCARAAYARPQLHTRRYFGRGRVQLVTVSFRAVPHFVSEAIGALTGIDAKTDDAWHSRLLLCALHSFLLLAGQSDCYHCGCGCL
jgi:hypothetical protein